MNFAQSVETCMRKVFKFNGRASRSEFWWFFLFTMLVNTFAELVLVDMIDELDAESTRSILFLLMIWIALIVAVLWMTIASITVSIRRLHDTGRSGWHLLWYLTIIGIVWVFYCWVSAQGTSEANEYGEPIISDGNPVESLDGE